MDMGVVTPTILYAFVAHLIELALWAALFMICGGICGLRHGLLSLSG